MYLAMQWSSWSTVIGRPLTGSVSAQPPNQWSCNAGHRIIIVLRSSLYAESIRRSRPSSLTSRNRLIPSADLLAAYVYLIMRSSLRSFLS
ncbi:hypothetical protein BDW68DRAFT_166470 [Aspergillus falconensis]